MTNPKYQVNRSLPPIDECYHSRDNWRDQSDWVYSREMRRTEHDLRQINQEYLASLSLEQLLHLSEKMLDDLHTARKRLSQSPQNSSRPSGSYAQWE